MRLSTGMVQFLLVSILLPRGKGFFTELFQSPPTSRRDVPSLSQVMEEAAAKRFHLPRHPRSPANTSTGPARDVSPEEVMESKRKSRQMSELLDSLFNNYDMFIRPGFDQSEPLVIGSNMVLTSMGPFSDFEAPSTFLVFGGDTATQVTRQQQAQTAEDSGDSRRIAVDPEAGVQVSGGSKSKDSGSYSVVPEFTFQCFFRHFWSDPRLAFDRHLNSSGNENSSVQVLMLNSIMLSRVWKPDTYFRGNGQNSYIHDITRPNQLFRLSPNGSICFSSRLTISARCPMNFANFPMDQQECNVEFGSFGYDNSQILYKWMDDALDIAQDSRLSQFEFRDASHSARNHTYRSGNYSILSVRFRFRRNIGYFIMQTYLPCMMIVVLSWVAFWINREAAPARISLGITTVLTMTTFAISSRQQIPKVSYPSAMDWFVLACYFFVFFALVEYAAVNYFTKRGEAGRTPGHGKGEGPPAKRPRMAEQLCCGSPSASFPDEWAEGTEADEPPFRAMNSCLVRLVVCLCGSVQYKTYKLAHINTQFNSVSHIDEICRIGFPALFALFNLGYWTVYLNTGWLRQH